MADPGRRPPGPNAVAALVLIALVVALLVWQRPWQGTNTPTATIPADASSRLAGQFRALAAAGSEQEFVAAAGPSSAAHTFARRTWQSLRAVAVRDLDLRYVSGGDVADRPDGSATASVEVTWRPGARSGLTDTEAHRTTVAFGVVPGRDGELSIVSARASGAAVPIWLVGAVSVERAHDITVVRVGGGDRRLPVEAMATTAQAAVTRLVPGAERRGTIISPKTQRQAAQLVGQSERGIDQIAAITTRLDADPAADPVVILNPSVFATMDRRASQVVLTHEATHLLTRATGSAAEPWVVEGFADFVALHDDTAPLSVSAGQILREVKAGALPSRLPRAADFEAANHGLGAVYESAWLIFRMLGDRHGDDEVVAFYEAVIGGRSVDGALQSSFGLTVEQLTANWRDYLSKSASTVS